MANPSKWIFPYDIQKHNVLKFCRALIADIGISSCHNLFYLSAPSRYSASIL